MTLMDQDKNGGLHLCDAFFDLWTTPLQSRSPERKCSRLDSSRLHDSFESVIIFNDSNFKYNLFAEACLGRLSVRRNTKTLNEKPR